MLADGERLRPVQGVALALATAGIAVIGAHTGGETTLVGLALVLVAAAAWAGGNQVARSMGRVQMLGVVVWSSAFALPPLLLLTLWVDGPARIAQALAAADAAVWAAVLWQTVANTLFGYAAWGWLLARHPAATISPLALLVPVFGMGASALVLGEALPPWKLAAALLVLSGLALNLFGARWAGLAKA
jgi:O-acetylserine/cysteine efflux transporter